jgi:FkbM family methyltransferase
MSDLETKAHSQIGQDIWVIEQVFKGKKGGFFVEAGGADGVYLSNTYVLEKHHGWKGICVEPNKNLFSELVKNRRSTNLNVSLGDKGGKTVYMVDRALLSTVARTPESAQRSLPKSKTKDVFEVTQRTLTDVLDTEGAPSRIEYLSLDVEGYEYEILKGFDFGRYTFLAMSIETVHLGGKKAALLQLLSDNGYICVMDKFLSDSFFIHKSVVYDTPSSWFVDVIVPQLCEKAQKKLRIKNPSLFE